MTAYSAILPEFKKAKSEAKRWKRAALRLARMIEEPPVGWVLKEQAALEEIRKLNGGTLWTSKQGGAK